MQLHTLGRITLQVSLGHDGALKAVFVRFAQALQAIRYGAQLTGKAYFTEDDCVNG